MYSKGLAGKAAEGIEIRGIFEAAGEVGRPTSKKGGHCWRWNPMFLRWPDFQDFLRTIWRMLGLSDVSLGVSFVLVM